MSMQFALTTPAYRLQARGIARPVIPNSWRAVEVAQAARDALADATPTHANGQDGNTAQAINNAPGPTTKPIVVGVIPFDTDQPAMLYVPEEVEWSPGTETIPPEEQSRANPHADRSQGSGDGTGRDRGATDGSRNDQNVANLDVTDLDSPGYRATVATAVRRIQQGELDKVVLARTVTVRAIGDFDPDAVFANLVAANPTAYNYRFDLPGSDRRSTLLGASPELVLASREGLVESYPLAGSTPRGADPAADREACERLRNSAKELAEHAHVTRAVTQIFRDLADDVDAPEQPELVATPVLWHLGTRITGRLRPTHTPLELAYALHPTPAVSGWPQAAARQAISELEDFDRGPYAGLIGWTDAERTGEWALALRGGIVSGNTATLYAGAGIVAASDPEQEHAETAVKFHTFARALGISEIVASPTTTASPGTKASPVADR